MFIGFIKETGIIQQINQTDSGVEVMMQTSSQFAAEIQVNSYIAIDGRILTVLHKEDSNDFSLVKVYAPHVEKITNFLPKKRVNLERAIRLGEEIPGLFFNGIPSGQVKVVYFEKLSGGRLSFKVSFKDDFVNYLSINDQICLNGVSLQIKNIEADELSFKLSENTLNSTNLGEIQIGDLLTIEIDPFTAKIARIFQKNKLLEVKS